MTQRVLIAGCGDVGARLGARLVARGCEVWGLRRKVEALPPGLRPLAADLAHPESLAELPPDLDLVFYTASAGGFDEAAYRRAYPEGLSNLLAALTAQGQRPRRLLFTSSTSVYPQDDGSWVDESSSTEPEHFSGRQLLAAEAVLHAGQVPGVAVRFGGIYGPGRTRLLDQLQAGEANCVETPPQWTNRIHADDCARALDHLGRLDEPAPLYLAVDDEPAEQCRVLRWLAGRLEVQPPRVIAAGEASGRALRSNKRCSNRRLAGSGFRLRYPTFRDGYGALLAGGGAGEPGATP